MVVFHWKGYLAVAAGIIVHITLGTLYTFGNMTPYLTSYLRYEGIDVDLTYSESIWIFSLTAMGQGASMFVGGIMYPKLGPRLTTLIGAWISSGGVALTYFTIHKSFTLVVITYGLIFGLGLGIAYAVPLNCGHKWFPHHKGLVSGFVVAGFGSGAFIFDQIQTAFLNPENKPADLTVGGDKYFTEPTILKKVPDCFLLLGGCYAVIQLIGCLLLSDPPDQYEPLHANMADNEDEYHAVQSPPTDNSLTPKETLQTAAFYQLWFIYLFNGQGIQFVSGLYKAYGQTFIKDDHFLAIVGSLAAICNGCGRIMWGYLADKYSFRLAMMFSCGTFAALTLSFGLTSLVGKGLYLVYVCLLFLCFSGNFSLLPTATSKSFGQTHYPLNYGLVFTASMAETEEYWSDWSETDLNKICNIGAAMEVESDSDPDDSEPLINITSNRRYRLLNLVRKVKERNGEIRNTQFIIKRNRHYAVKTKQKNSKLKLSYENRQIKKKYKEVTATIKPKFAKSPQEKNVQGSSRTKRKSKQTANKKLAKVCINLEDQDDSSDDKTYIPGKNDYTSESDNDSVQNNLTSRGQPTKNKESKQKTKKIEAKKKSVRRPIFTPSPRKEKNVGKPKSPSSSAVQATKILLKYHTSRLDNLLKSNGLKRHPVYPDGNCFMKTILFYLQEEGNTTETVQTLRNKISQHLTDNMANYITYLTFNDSTTNQEKIELYKSYVDDLKQNGHWNNALADCMPLVIANIYGRTVRVFASRTQNPLYDIQPDILKEAGVNVQPPNEVGKNSQPLNEDGDNVQPQNEVGENAQPPNEVRRNLQTPILVAFFAIKGKEHYDGVKRIGDDLNSPQTTPTKETSSATMTPRKRADYKSPPKKQLFRKRKGNPSTWKRNIKKQKRQSGCEYINEKGNKVPERKLHAINCSKCKFKCSVKVTQENREVIFRTYWNLSSYDKQRAFICQNVQDKTPTRITTNRRGKSNAFHLPVNSERVRVCKTFFLKTLDIGKKTVTYAIKNKVQGVFVGEDKRGKNTPRNKTPDASLKFIRKHIESFPAVSSHYTRKHSARKYLNSDLTIKTMYHLYIDKCKKEKKKAAGFSVYRDTFCNEYNLGFHKPKKDQCTLCTIYENAKQSDELTDELIEEYDQHQRLKTESRQAKEHDKEKARSDKTFVCATFDLEAVLPSPCTLVGDLYYKRCLSTYNLSFYSLGDRKGTCFVWDETNGGRGSCEIATCLLMHINSVSEKNTAVKEITYYSDTCSGQNRNQYVSSALLYAVNNVENIEAINHKFLEKGHSEMESDSIHAAVEFAKKRTKIYVPSQWDTVIAMARKTLPYLVVPMKFSDFVDLKEFCKCFCKNMKKGSGGERINWLKVKWIRLVKCKPKSVFVNYGYDEGKFIEIITADRSTRGRPQSISNAKLETLYDSKRSISAEKKKDLLSLCRSGIIPSEYHSYYEQLPGHKKVKDTLPESDIEDDDEDTDCE